MNAESAERAIEERFKRTVAADDKIHIAHMMVHSDKL